MRLLVFLRGVSGTGKSTWVKNQGLEGLTISPDELRLQLAGKKFNQELQGFGVSQDRDKQVWRLVQESVEFRMKQGQTIYLDATFKNPKAMKPYIDLAERYFYKWSCVDFGDKPKTNNLDRGIHSVPDSIVEKQKELYEEVTPQVWYSDILDELIPVIPHYKNMYFIGDIHGCYEPFKKFIDKVDTNSSSNCFIFAGDYLDRGPDNLNTFRLLEEMSKLPNVYMLMGNHEVHWRDYLTGNKVYKSTTFGRETLPQLLEGYKEKDLKKVLKRILNKTKDCFRIPMPLIPEFAITAPYHWIMTHAGIDVPVYSVTDPFFLINLHSNAMWKGVAGYDFLPYKEEQCAMQIHGHRNNEYKLSFGRPMSGDYERALTGICLESKVESGGSLSVLRIGDRGIEDLSENSPIIRTSQASEGFLDSLNTEIEEKRVRKKTYGHIDSYIFVPKVFYKKLWNNVNIKARGLFINNETNDIVARGYEKFFNLGEELAPTLDKLQYPVTIYKKENGFLGILSWDHSKNELFISSKSSPTSDFSEIFKEILFDQCDKESIIRYMSNTGQNHTLVFEVIDPVRDPHVIQYGKPEVILLDMIENTENFRLASDSLMKQAAKVMGCKTKQRITTFTDEASLLKFVNNKMSYTQNLDEVYSYDWSEGYVLKDVCSEMVKIKLPFYRDVRYLREIFKSATSPGDFKKETRSLDFPISNALMDKGYEYVKNLPGDNIVDKVYGWLRSRN